MGAFIDFLTFYSTITISRKYHGRVMEKSLNFILGFLYEPWIKYLYTSSFLSDI